MSTLREKLRAEIQDADWTALRQHLQRDAIITIAESLDLTEVAEAVARDDKTRVSEWIGSGLIGKPSQQELTAWEAAMDRKFRFVIVAPYVLVQKIGH